MYAKKGFISLSQEWKADVANITVDEHRPSTGYATVVRYMAGRWSLPSLRLSTHENKPLVGEVGSVEYTEIRLLNSQA